MSKVDDNYNREKETPSDINEHLEALYNMACDCETIVEFGVRKGISSTAFIAARPKFLISCDIEIHPEAEDIFQAGKDEGITCDLVKCSSFDVNIPQVDAVFIDTEHTAACLSKELELHGNKARKYLAFHDTVSFGSELMPVIDKFRKENPHWKVHEIYHHNNGLLILKREG